MQFYYEEKMPLRILDEGEFWKMQESEHTQVIRALIPDLNPAFIEALKKWELALSQTQGTFVSYVETVVRYKNHPLPPKLQCEIRVLVQFALEQSEMFIVLLNQIAQDPAVASNPTAITVLNHIRRESEYFIGIARMY